MIAAALLCALLAAPADDALAELQELWPELTAPGRVKHLDKLARHRSTAILAQAQRWLRDEDPRVRAAVVRVIASGATDPQLRRRAEGMIAAYLKSHMSARAKREQREFRDVCREHGTELPPDNEIAAGRDWTDPYNEHRRKLTPEIALEREHMRAILAAIEEARAKELRPMILRVFHEHHDPDVVVRVIELFGAWKDWHALVPMADLLRIQYFGREVGGGVVIGKKNYETLRLKWDVHKDRLWWSRPEYVPRIPRHVFKAVLDTTGAEVNSSTSFDAWLLEHEDDLGKHGVKLSAAFRKRVQISQR